MSPGRGRGSGRTFYGTSLTLCLVVFFAAGSQGSLGRFCRVEYGRGNLGHAATPRFPSPLIERSVRISSIKCGGPHLVREFAALASSPSRVTIICSWSMSRLPRDSSRKSNFSWAVDRPPLTRMTFRAVRRGSEFQSSQDHGLARIARRRFAVLSASKCLRRGVKLEPCERL